MLSRAICGQHREDPVPKGEERLNEWEASREPDNTASGVRCMHLLGARCGPSGWMRARLLAFGDGITGMAVRIIAKRARSAVGASDPRG